ncbi:hypothetical protein BDY21DRAFT_112223 [Lineolata rhizophorae]|uniref:SRR1-like domain-containing protein n=1 Tax=Lineolata rhizophorae TaxID=578093 RepID=A0A6A6NR94_9PEZI|nr:hypothetical protein BDY21DRAFT_112223 [Lineolata rhizophorae]
MVGSGCFAEESVARSRAAMWQFVMFVEVVGLLESASGRHIQLYAQEPDYFPLDEEFLASFDVIVLKHPAAVDVVSSVTFLFCPFVPWKLMLLFLERGDPSLYIGTNVSELLETMEHVWRAEAAETSGVALTDEIGTGSLDDYRSAARRFLTGRKEYSVPRSDLNVPALHGLKLYWACKPD